MTTDEEFAFCEKTDRIFDALLGRNLLAGTLRLALIAAAVCVIVASLSPFTA